ncbi:MAG: TIM barrel protein, partial [Eubacteriales bacterium]|nr:TIM barrel protein [Eubacteriales bacterium]
KICSMFDTLKACAEIAEASGIRMNLEALNITTDHAGNFLKTTQMGAEMTRLINCDKLKLLYDVYHMQLNEGAIIDTMTTYIDQIGHVHVADAPGRHEPGTGEINYTNVYACLEKLGYQDRVGYELFPLTTTTQAVQAIMAG